MENLLNIIIPPNCMFCGKPGKVFCEVCLQSCERAKFFYCVACDTPVPGGFTHSRCQKPGVPVRALYVYLYKGVVRQCIKYAKYKRREFAGFRVLSKIAAKIIYAYLKQSQPGYLDGFVVVPVPVSREREKERGFNQAEIVAEEFCRVFKLRKENSILTRVKNTQAQHSFNRTQRFENMQGAFSATKLAKDKKVLLVDDVSTTGATFLACANVLYNSGAKEVVCFSLAKKI